MTVRVCKKHKALGRCRKCEEERNTVASTGCPDDNQRCGEADLGRCPGDASVLERALKAILDEVAEENHLLGHRIYRLATGALEEYSSKDTASE